MIDGTRQAVLQLNQAFEPTAFCSARRALTLVIKDKAIVVAETDREVRPGMLYPSVIRLKEFVYVPHKMQTLSRKNILLRDRNVCQYCETKFHASELTLDHVIPRSRGGKDTWENLVACCSKCNRKKADKTCEESGMFPLHRPRPATINTARYIIRCTGVDHPQWKPYLYTESDKKNVTHGVA
jgi:5-methylcytosine-specific restriction endonuclease McrA